MSTYTGNQKYFYIHRPALPVTAVKCTFFRKHKLTYIKTMSSQASSSASPALITEEISTRTMSDVVKDFNTEELIDYLGRKNLKLNKDDIKILHKEKISGLAFLELTEEKFRSIGLALESATTLAKFIEGFGQKIRNYFSLKSLDDLKEMLRRNKVNGKDILNINQFTPSR
ncbi:hypothetical protein GLOIN_2v1483414 [Rhizophagus irregularis DAOM 181602=DAOM 197198]|uniref:SAM domain-containing protein n=1 Tax=Rhizophagus irregularis (strain DAOM 181602 / DAOM 197198 / MUCL 43194) TaxID=747089 RepID=A0A2P4PHZ8_RHIID|nr:hypothetical protein GLOIN_2v1483414 [Rhizophagus irregularis DAOM 181602=DAOM 197198]POG65015.1 hypothetical protein GLOIN_2v1483414 [Rhizophagus irregularis DAOM 181602=DAOM 197198]|eukprot:XP_025171881.1 hypothetical protein GLOIN_2v1483414 [Rhizophagus irregularis DAOM 181602=DAOM 197198]